MVSHDKRIGLYGRHSENFAILYVVRLKLYKLKTILCVIDKPLFLKTGILIKQKLMDIMITSLNDFDFTLTCFLNGTPCILFHN